MECLTPTASFDLYMDKYFTSLRLFAMLTHIGVNKIQVKETKIGYANTLSSGTHIERSER